MQEIKSTTTTVFLNGGLGNQLFQWAMGYARSKELNTDLCLNLSNLSRGQFELAKFDLPGHSISTVFHNSYRIRNKYIKRIWMLPTLYHHYYEKKFGYQMETRKKRLRNFHGYFQSTKYFEKYITEIAQLLRRKVNPSPELISYLQWFHQRKVLALHVRRGDYLEFEDYHGVLPVSYYQEALRKFKEDEYDVAVFSNDIEYARKLFSPSCLFIGPSDLPCAAENLVLMSNASAIIGANSTLSLWAALIMDARSEVKVFPEPWFKTTLINTSDLVPEGFTRVRVSF